MMLVEQTKDLSLSHWSVFQSYGKDGEEAHGTLDPFKDKAGVFRESIAPLYFLLFLENLFILGQYSSYQNEVNNLKYVSIDGIIAFFIASQEIIKSW